MITYIYSSDVRTQVSGSMISTSRERLAIDLRTYGEAVLADRVPALTDGDVRRVGEIAFTHACTGMLIAKAVTLAAIEVMEGSPRPPKWGRRKLKGIYPEEGVVRTHETGEATSDLEATQASSARYATSKALEGAVFDSLTPRLQTLGFRKRERGIFTKDLSAEVIGWLGIPAGLDRRTVYVDMYVNVGVRHQPTERLLAELTQTKFHPHSPSTVGISIDSLRVVREHLGWRFSGDVDIGETVEDMAAAIRQYALPWMEAHSTLEAMLAEQTKHPHWPMPSGGDSRWPLRVPVMHALGGNAEEGTKLVQRVLRDIEFSRGAWDDYYRRFAENFLSRFSTVIR